MSIFICRDFGFEWERRLVDMATQRGHRAALAGKMLVYDVVIDGMKVQCKRKNYQDPCGGIRVAKGQKRYSESDYDVLALDFQGRVFFIPSQTLRMPGGTLATKVRLQKYLQYEDNWGVFLGGGHCDGADQKTFW